MFHGVGYRCPSPACCYSHARPCVAGRVQPRVGDRLTQRGAGLGEPVRVERFAGGAEHDGLGGAHQGGETRVGFPAPHDRLVAVGA